MPVTALVGTTTSADVRSAATVTGLTIVSLRLPALSVIANTTSVVLSRLLPCSVMVWPGLADAWPATAGVPLAAPATSPVKVRLNEVLVPPTVDTRIGPVGTPSGTAR